MPPLPGKTERAPPPCPAGYVTLKLAAAIKAADASNDPQAAAWLAWLLSSLHLSMLADGHEDSLDAELAGLDSAGMGRAAVAQEATRFRLLTRMWTAR